MNVKWTREKELMTFTTTQNSATETETETEEGGVVRTRVVTVMSPTTRIDGVAGGPGIVDVTRMDGAAAAVEEDIEIEDVVPILLMMVQVIRKIFTKIPMIPSFQRGSDSPEIQAESMRNPCGPTLALP